MHDAVIVSTARTPVGGAYRGACNIQQHLCRRLNSEEASLLRSCKDDLLENALASGW